MFLKNKIIVYKIFNELQDWQALYTHNHFNGMLYPLTASLYIKIGFPFSTWNSVKYKKTLPLLPVTNMPI